MELVIMLMDLIMLMDEFIDVVFKHESGMKQVSNKRQTSKPHASPGDMDISFSTTRKC